MGKFNRNDRSGGDFKKRAFGRSDRGDRGDFGPRSSMHQAICSECGKTCEVPFRPTGEKPVYCNDCFRSKRTGDSRQSGGSRGFDRSSFGGNRTAVSEGIIKEQFEMLNTKLDRILKALNPISSAPALIEEKEVKTLKAGKEKKTEKKVKPAKAEKTAKTKKKK